MHNFDCSRKNITALQIFQKARQIERLRGMIDRKKIEKEEGLQTLVSLGIPKYVPGTQDGF